MSSRIATPYSKVFPLLARRSTVSRFPNDRRTSFLPRSRPTNTCKRRTYASNPSPAPLRKEVEWPATSPFKSIAEDLIDFSWRAWLKLFIVASSGITLGSLAAIHGSAWLAQLGIFVYEPDDDDDDDDADDNGKEDGPEGKKSEEEVKKERQAQHTAELASLFGDYRLNVAFNWTNADVTYITLAKEKLASALAELDQVMDQKNLDDLDNRETELVRKFLKDAVQILQLREQAARDKQDGVEQGGRPRSPWWKRIVGH
ncbi:uncharacterized protein EV422DRAFT_566298 [Fimicolochytrium jonesii]|uniref:uncharacterized protein n=1 Tax=Fimicolochytrium jonesii TaxID=1396493 RepID=UPI0022FEDA84|nr:uncharacterized protein EV422DRAFT_566298 [Fimicolochytrium jonesii]KAI8822621.1 hypothetical protein EV422DRAFT_566298 [Fimicolochytrium jonesii]